MATLSISAEGELRLTLKGAEENDVLMTLRRWPHWLSATVERSPEDDAQIRSVTLVADPIHEPTLRGILKHGFGMTFPVDGGENETVAVRTPASTRHGRK